MATTYRCLPCAGQRPPSGQAAAEFEHAPAGGKGPACPACGAAGAMLAEVEAVHYDPPRGAHGLGTHSAACDPSVGVGRPRNTMMTGEPSAVTCRACRRTAVYGEQAARRGIPAVPPEHDFVPEPADAGK